MDSQIFENGLNFEREKSLSSNHSTKEKPKVEPNSAELPSKALDNSSVEIATKA